MVRSVAHQAAGLRELAAVVDRGHRVTCRKRDELGAADKEEWIGRNQQSRPWLERRIGVLDLAIGAGLQDIERHFQGAAVACRLWVTAFALGWLGLSSTAMVLACGASSRSKPSRFADSSAARVVMPVALTPGRLRLLTRPSSTGGSAIRK